jgi:hypothetical protein
LENRFDTCDRRASKAEDGSLLRRESTLIYRSAHTWGTQPTIKELDVLPPFAGCSRSESITGDLIQ